MEYIKDTVLTHFCSSLETQEIINNLSSNIFFAVEPKIDANNILDEVTQQGFALAQKNLGLKDEAELTKHFQKNNAICKIMDNVSVQTVSNTEYAGTLDNISETSIRLSRTKIYRRDMTLNSRALFWKDDNALYIKKLVNDEMLRNEQKVMAFCREYIS